MALGLTAIPPVDRTFAGGGAVEAPNQPGASSWQGNEAPRTSSDASTGRSGFQPPDDPGEPARDLAAEGDDAADLPGPDKPRVAQLRKLTSDEINRIRYMELRAFRMNTDRPDRITVKVPRQTVNDFLLEMEGDPDFRGEAKRRAFRVLTPPQKLHKIARYMGDAFVDRVSIESDPEVFVAFRKQVMPLVLRGCATTGCHSPSYRDDARFGLFNDPKRSSATTYANFILLSELTAGREEVINRAQPQNSLLLMYMLPDSEVRQSMRHPASIALRPIYQSREALGYKRIEQWIASLRHPAPNYGVSFFDDGTPTGDDGMDDNDAAREEGGERAGDAPADRGNFPDRDAP